MISKLENLSEKKWQKNNTTLWTIFPSILIMVAEN